ncbi:lipopolysaccharide-induced tumor necrosis factor-alpha factor homolog [Malaya genurostris]|uniref:lipopolysaccharide-induced tumor necrosis factor-alpha factor homolog n=1 Tax=Malaya genurostris TaxID=325434 RepID=UPI0026F3B2DE|nr:lipopolysaccharide-induced tumor necrosis factor-alpha factor homolog [Malaya genurostris]
MDSEKSHPPSYDQLHDSTPSAYPHRTIPTIYSNVEQSPPIPSTTTVIVTNSQVGPDPTTLTCPSCRATIVTRLEYETTTRTHVCAALLCLFICWPCVCIPYCSTSCRDANHYCPNCGSFIGTYRK